MNYPDVNWIWKFICQVPALFITQYLSEETGKYVLFFFLLFCFLPQQLFNLLQSEVYLSVIILVFWFNAFFHGFSRVVPDFPYGHFRLCWDSLCGCFCLIVPWYGLNLTGMATVSSCQCICLRDGRWYRTRQFIFKQCFQCYVILMSSNFTIS